MDYQIVSTTVGNVSYRKLGSGQRKILFFHGFPGSSAQIGIFRALVDTLNLEVLCFDRPGYNYSQIQTADSLATTLSIANELISINAWTDFEIVTVSGGTPFGIAYAIQHPEKIRYLRVICGLGNLCIPEVRTHFSKTSLYALRFLPMMSGYLIQKFIGIKPMGSRRGLIITFFLPASVPDSKLFQNSDVLSALNLSLSEALLQKALGPKQDAKVFLTDWSKGSNSLQRSIHFWHGDQDQTLSIKSAKAMIAQFPFAKMTVVKDEGHISLPTLHIETILKTDL